MKQEVKTVPTTVAGDPLALEQEKTQQLLQGIREIAPRLPYYEGMEYYSKTLLNRMRNCSPDQPGYLFVSSLPYVLKEEDGKICVHINHNHSDTYVKIGWPNDLTLGIGVDWKKTANVRLNVRNFSYSPDQFYPFSDKGRFEGLNDQVYANSVLKLMDDDLKDNQVNWGKGLQEKREENFEMIRSAIGKERFWVISNSLRGIAQVAGDEENMVFAPDIMEEEGLRRVVLYTTATLTEGLASNFSSVVAGGCGRYYPTEYRSSNARDVKPSIATRFYDNLTVEIRGVKKPYHGQAQDIRSSFAGHMSGDEQALTFTHFPPNTPHGVKTTLVAINPPLPVF